MLISMNREEFCFWWEDEIKKAQFIQNVKTRKRVIRYHCSRSLRPCAWPNTHDLNLKTREKLEIERFVLQKCSRNTALDRFLSLISPHPKPRHEENSPATAEKSKLPSNFSHHRAAEVLHANETKVLWTHRAHRKGMWHHIYAMYLYQNRLIGLSCK